MNTRRVSRFIGLTLAIAFVLLACDLSALTQAGMPAVSIASPSNGAQVALGQEVVVQASATDSTGITRIELWVDGALATMPQTTAPQTSFTAALRWTPATPGAHTLIVRATNVGGVTGDSSVITVNVISTGASTNIPTSAASTGCSKPTIQEFGVSPTTIAQGQVAVVYWTVMDAESVMLIGGDFGKKLVGLLGKEEIKPGATTTYTLHIESCAGPYDVQTTITVGLPGVTLPTQTPTATPNPGAPPPPPPPPCSGTPNISSFTASPTTIPAGGSSTLNWGVVSNAESVEINQGIGSVASSGSRTVSPGSTTTYTLTARCGSNTRTAQATITVSGAPATFAVTGATASVDSTSSTAACPINFNLSGTISANSAGTVTYRWERSDGPGSTETITFTGAGSRTITSVWQLGARGNFWVRLHVLTPNDISSNQASFTNNCGSAFAVTGVTASVNPGTYSGVCPASLNFSANITTNGAGTVSYRWERSDNGLGSVQTLNFTGAGSQTISTGPGNPGITGAGWYRLHILTPNDTYSNQANFTNNCGSASTFQVIGATASADPTTYSGACPGSFNFSANITTNGAGAVTYRWERSDGGAGSVQTLNFTGAGSQTISTGPGNPGITGAGWYQVHILTPNNTYSTLARFTNNCGTAFAVTSMTASIGGPASPYTGFCPPTVSLVGMITANGAGTVHYVWECNIGLGSCGYGDVTFAGPGTRTVTDSYMFPNMSGDRWFRLWITAPSEMRSNQANFTNNCHN